MLLDSWLALQRLSPADFGRRLGLRWPYSVRRYLRHDAYGRPRKDWRAPRYDIQRRIQRLTEGWVSPKDWER